MKFSEVLHNLLAALKEATNLSFWGEKKQPKSLKNKSFLEFLGLVIRLPLAVVEIPLRLIDCVEPLKISCYLSLL